MTGSLHPGAEIRCERPLEADREAPSLFLCYFILSRESGLASFVAKVLNPADLPLLAPPEIEFLLKEP